MIKVKIDQAEAVQLRTFAQLEMGLDIPKTLNADQIRSKIKAAGWTQDEINLRETEVDLISEVVTEGGENDRVGLYYRTRDIGGKKIKRAFMNITIPEQERPGGGEPAPVNCNGRQLFIPRGKICSVPMEYIEILEHAVEQLYKQAPGPEGGIIEDRKVQAFPFNINDPGEEVAEMMVA